jgi:L-alanine-DL-glutamate epimerase-like enolase superfamily enzyme
MKITKLRTQIVHFPFDPPIDGGALLLRSADCVLVFLETDAGLIGEGLVFALNKQRLIVIDEMIRSLEPLVVGLDPELGGSFSARAFRDIGFLGRTGVAVIGVAGVDNALWDLRGKTAGLNVARLIGACATAVPAYHSGGLWISRSIDALQREAADFVAQGWRAMKMRIGKPRAEDDVARVRAVREAIGPDIGLMVDSNQQLTVPRAIRLGRMLEEFNLTWFEEPVPHHDHAGEAQITAALDTPVASGESVYGSRGILEMLRVRASDIVMPDLQHMGGPTEFMKAAAFADAYDTPASNHCYTEMSMQLLAAIPNFIVLEYMPWLEPIYAERLKLDSNGNAIVPDVPGWGFTIDQTAIKKFAFAR